MYYQVMGHPNAIRQALFLAAERGIQVASTVSLPHTGYRVVTFETTDVAAETIASLHEELEAYDDIQALQVPAEYIDREQVQQDQPRGGLTGVVWI